MEDEKDRSGVSLKRMDKNALRLGIAALAGILGLPFVVTQCTFGYDLGVGDANEIGDTLGGILGPFIGLISAFLVYLALREQIKANNIIQGQFKKEEINKSEDFYFSIFMDKIETINKMISENHFINYQSNSYKGKESVSRLIKELSDIHLNNDFYNLSKKEIIANSQNYIDSIVKVLILIDILFVYSTLCFNKIKDPDKLKVVFLEFENIIAFTFNYDSALLFELFKSDFIKTNKLEFFKRVDNSMFIMLAKLIALEAETHLQIYPERINRYGTSFDVIYKDLNALNELINKFRVTI